jgi:hypothetical protein
MTVYLGSIVLGASNVRRAMELWSRALGYVTRDEPDDTWVVLRPASGVGPNIALGLSSTPVQERPRVHLDLYTSDQAGEVERMVGLGATRVDWHDYPEDPDFVVLADTEGNRFCVIDHR